MAIVTLPSQFFMVAGKGDSEYALNAFDLALLDAGIGNLNLIKVSSILPPLLMQKKQAILKAK